MTSEIFQYGAFALSAVACIVSVATYFRNGKWRDSDEGKELVKRLDAAGSWSTSDTARAWVQRIDGVEDRVTTLEAHQDHLATKADIKGLKAELEGVESTVNAKIDGIAKSLQVVAGGVNRIETFFLEKGVK